MAENKSLPQLYTLDELVEFFETHDMGDYWDKMPEANFEVDLKKRTHVFTLDADLADRLTEVAKAQHTPSEKIINAWLREKLQPQA